MPICPTCLRNRQPRERIERKKGKEWLIDYCRICGYNFDIHEWKHITIDKEQLDDTTKRKAGWFKSRFSGEAD